MPSLRSAPTAELKQGEALKGGEGTVYKGAGPLHSGGEVSSIIIPLFGLL